MVGDKHEFHTSHWVQFPEFCTVLFLLTIQTVTKWQKPCSRLSILSSSSTCTEGWGRKLQRVSPALLLPVLISLGWFNLGVYWVFTKAKPILQLSILWLPISVRETLNMHISNMPPLQTLEVNQSAYITNHSAWESKSAASSFVSNWTFLELEDISPPMQKAKRLRASRFSEAL